MNAHDNSLVDLARHMQRGLPSSSPEHLREAIEDSLMPMIRCALRSGVGHPSLVRWVREQMPSMPDPARAARPMARLLCERLMERIDPLHGRETVLGA